MWKLIIIFTFFCVPNVDSASLEAEKNSEYVTLKVYQYSTSEWTSSDKQASLEARIAADVNLYCLTSPSSCGLLYWHSSMQFGLSDIGINTEDENKNMQVKVYITYSSAANISETATTSYVLNKASTFAVLSDNKATIETAIGLQITYIDDVYYGIKVSKRENEIIIPISLVVVVLLIIVVIVMSVWNKRKSKQKRQTRKKQKALNPVKVTPKKHSLTVLDSLNDNFLHENRSQNAHANSRPNEVRKQTQVATQQPAIVAICVNEFTSETTHPATVVSQLPPIPQDEVQVERKKKKKRKKHHHHREDHHVGESESENTISNEHSYPGNEADSQQTTMFM